MIGSQTFIRTHAQRERQRLNYRCSVKRAKRKAEEVRRNQSLVNESGSRSVDRGGLETI